MSKRKALAQVFSISDYHKESAPFGKPRGKAKVLAFKRPKYTPQFRVGDSVRLRYPKEWPNKRNVMIVPNMRRDEVRQITQIKPLFEKFFLVSFDDLTPMFDERFFELAEPKISIEDGELRITT